MHCIKGAHCLVPVELYNLISAISKRLCANSFICLIPGTVHLRTRLFPYLASLFSAGRTCPWPLPSRENSVARLLSPTNSFSALLEVRCKPGFALPTGLDVTIRRCQGDRQWSGDEPICTGGFEFTGRKYSFFSTSSWFRRNQECTPQLIYTCVYDDTLCSWAEAAAASKQRVVAHSYISVNDVIRD